jgi:hypothetical protein
VITLKGVASFDEPKVEIQGDDQIKVEGGEPGPESQAQRVISRLGEKWKVKIELKPSQETASSAVEEVVEEGWEVSGINEDGFYDSKNRKVKWGPWLRSQAKKARTLEYELSAPEGFTGVITLKGVSSFDGSKAEIQGDDQIEAKGGMAANIFITEIQKMPFGFSFTAENEKTYIVEVTQDFKQWGELQSYNGTGQPVKFSDLRQPNVPFKRNYYRIKLVE